MQGLKGQSNIHRNFMPIDLCEYVEGEYGPFHRSELILPMHEKATMAHVIDLSKVLLDFVNVDEENQSEAYQLSAESLASLMCIDSSKLKRFRSSSSVLDEYGIASALKMVADNFTWFLDDCEKLYKKGDYDKLVLTRDCMVDAYSDAKLTNVDTFLCLFDREQIKSKIRAAKRNSKVKYSKADAEAAFDSLAEHEIAITSNFVKYSDILQKEFRQTASSNKPVVLSETGTLLLRVFSTFPEYAGKMNIYDVPYHRFVSLISDCVPTRSYIGFLLARMPSHSSRWQSERHTPKAETQRLINVLYLYFSQFENSPVEMIEALRQWRNLVGYTATVFGRKPMNKREP